MGKRLDCFINSIMQFFMVIGILVSAGWFVPSIFRDSIHVVFANFTYDPGWIFGFIFGVSIPMASKYILNAIQLIKTLMPKKE